MSDNDLGAVRAMLVAAGFGTRLLPLTRHLPKGAVPVANRPLGWFALDHLARAGLREFLVNSHHLADRLERALSDVRPAGVDLEFVREASILGTGGGVHHAWQPRRDETLVVMNAKLVFAPDITSALCRHRERDAVATMVVRALPPGSSFAPVEVDAEGRVWRIRGLPERAPEGLLPCMYTGVQLLSARAHAELPESGDIIEHSYLTWLERGEPVHACRDDSPWVDAGVSLRQYLDTNIELATGERAWPGIEPDVRGVLAHPSARVAPTARLRACVVGPGAEVGQGVELERVVLWEGASVSESLQDAIAIPGELVQL